MSVDLCNPVLCAVLHGLQRTRTDSANKQQDSQHSIVAACSPFLGRHHRLTKPPTNRNWSPEPLPAELWIQIVEQHSSHKEWSTLSKTCWFFHQVACVPLYEKVVLCKYLDRDVVNGYLGRSIFLFQRSFDRCPELGAFVRNLSLHVEFLLPERRGDDSAYSLLSKLDQFPSLETLRVETFHIDAELCYALHSHRRLSAVEFEFCTVDDSLASTGLRHLLGSTISELKILSPSNNFSVADDTWAALAPPGLRALTVSSTYQQSGLSLILSSIMMAGRTHTLENLSINFFPGPIIPFLVSSPRLRHLTIDCDFDPVVYLTCSQLPVDAIPLLEYYTGPVELSEILLRNRPVHTVELTFKGNTNICANSYGDILASLQLSSVPITRLELWDISMSSLLWNVPISTRFLALHRLNEKTFTTWVPSLSRLENLHTLHWTINRPENKLRPEEITQISETCPSLREIRAGHQRWLAVKQNVWECFL